MKIITLHDPDGIALYINADAIAMFSLAQRENTTCIELLNETMIYVNESCKTIVDLINCNAGAMRIIESSDYV